ncbi:hypothetical protein ABZP36_016069 [Zizania latifolia]
MGLVATVVDAAIGWMMQTILGNFFSPQMQAWNHQAGLAEDVEMLESEMKSVQILLAAAEGRRIDSSPLSDSLHEVKELLYDAEDVTDELDYYRLQQHIEGKGSHAAACINPEGSLAEYGRMARSSRLTTSIPVERKLYGRDVEKKSIVELLMKGKTDDLGVVPLVGVGGVGKSTLARFVYHDQRIKDHFDLQMWYRIDLGVLPLVGVGGVGKSTLARFVYHDQRIKDHFDLRMWGLSAFPTMQIHKRMLRIKSKELIVLDGRIVPFHNLKSIRLMYLEHCPNLTCISSDGFSQLIALERLRIKHCPNLLQPYVMSELVDESSRPNTNYPVLPSLKLIDISSCGIAGRKLAQMLTHLQSLEILELCDCSQIKFLSISQPEQPEATSSLALAETTSARDEQLLNIPCNVTRSLKRLHICECPDLEFSGVNGGFGGCTSLVTLQIRGCPKLVSSLVTEANDNLLLPTSLQDLTIHPLPENLQSFFLKGLACRKKLRLCSGQYLKSVQLHSCKALENLQISDCPQLGVLQGLQHLSSLQRLDISMNPELSCAWDLKLQEQGQGRNHTLLFPLSLGELKIEYLQEDNVVHSRLLCLPSITKLQLGHSTDLKSLQLGYCNATLSAEEGCLGDFAGPSDAAAVAACVDDFTKKNWSLHSNI